MKTRNDLSYGHMALIALATELTLIAFQFIHLKIYSANNPDAAMGFSTEYMKSGGFYIFQIIGFFLYTFVVYMAAGKISKKILNKALTLVISGAIVELSFYMIIQSGYEGAFLYSILDKIIAVAFGLIFYNYTHDKVRKPESYV